MCEEVVGEESNGEDSSVGGQQYGRTVVGGQQWGRMALWEDSSVRGQQWREDSSAEGNSVGGQWGGTAVWKDSSGEDNSVGATVQEDSSGGGGTVLEGQ